MSALIEQLPLETPYGLVTELRLARPPANALDLALLDRLSDSLEGIFASETRGVVLSGLPGMFSAGVDVPSLMSLDRPGVARFWNRFFHVCGQLARAPIPVVAAVTGHSPAGGAVLALFCDYRVMAHGPYRIGLNETQVGLTAPALIQLALRRVVGAYRAERLLLNGTLLDADQALACGFVDELAPVEQVGVRALHWLTELLAVPSRAMLATRRIARADLINAFDDPAILDIEPLLDAFFHPQTQAVLQQLVARLRKKD